MPDQGLVTGGKTTDKQEEDVTFSRMLGQSHSTGFRANEQVVKSAFARTSAHTQSRVITLCYIYIHFEL